MQTYTSKMTSINSSKLPGIYKKIDWRKIMKYFSPTQPEILDYGCGRYINHIKDFIGDDFIWQGYDLYWNPIDIHDKYFQIIVCANVLNVIDNAKEIERIHKWIKTHSTMYFISVYEGDRSYISRETRKDCYQANIPTEDYMHYNEILRKKIITDRTGINFII